MVADPAANIRVHGTQYLLESLNADDRLLLVDDVSSSGLTLAVVRRRLEQRLKRNMPTDVRVATIWNKPASNKSGILPDYSVHETDAWLVLPYEITGLSTAEIEQHKPAVAVMLRSNSGSLATDTE
jgi:hypoxanthine-guanine phosphoribosyltransferase